jgi:hypothetical protein
MMIGQTVTMTRTAQNPPLLWSRQRRLQKLMVVEVPGEGWHWQGRRHRWWLYSPQRMA